MYMYVCMYECIRGGSLLWDGHLGSLCQTLKSECSHRKPFSVERPYFIHPPPPTRSLRSQDARLLRGTYPPCQTVNTRCPYRTYTRQPDILIMRGAAHHQQSTKPFLCLCVFVFVYVHINMGRSLSSCCHTVKCNEIKSTHLSLSLSFYHHCILVLNPHNPKVCPSLSFLPSTQSFFSLSFSLLFFFV